MAFMSLFNILEFASGTKETLCVMKKTACGIQETVQVSWDGVWQLQYCTKQLARGWYVLHANQETKPGDYCGLRTLYAHDSLKPSMKQLQDCVAVTMLQKQ